MPCQPDRDQPTSSLFALPYELDYMPEELRRRAKAELFEDEDTRVHSLRLLKNLLSEEKDLNWQDNDDFLLAFLRTRKFDVKKAASVAKNFYHVQRKHGELFDDLDFEDVKRTYEDNIVGFLPYRDEEGCVILIIKTENWQPARNNMGDIMRALTVGLLHAIKSQATQVAGFKVIVDFNGFTLSKLPHISATYLWLFAEALQNCFPGRFRAVHLVNEGHLFTYIWQCLKQLLTKKLRDRFHFHGKHVKKLHKYFHPSILPAEYEGELPTFDNSHWAKQVEQYRPNIEEMVRHGYVSHKKS